MSLPRSYAYFALTANDFDPAEVTKRLGLSPTQAWRKSELGSYKPHRKYACWELRSGKSQDNICINVLAVEVIAQLEDKAEEIMALKRELQLNSVLEIVMFVDVNEEQSTPALVHDLRTINFLYHTQTSVDVDIYRYNSSEAD